MSSARDLSCVDSPTQPGRGTWGSRFLSQEPRGPTATGCPLTHHWGWSQRPSLPPGAAQVSIPLTVTRKGG